MKILIEICHPAHVHYFRNLIKKLKLEGHSILILAQNRGIIQDLLNFYELEFVIFNNLPKNIFGKLLYLLKTDIIFYIHAKKFKPDILIGFAGAYISHIGFIINRPAIVLDDTEHAKLSHLSYKYFASAILTPTCFHKSLGEKQIKFDSFMELTYLNPKYFTPNTEVFQKLEIDKDKKTILIRFVSWRASHDIGQTGLSLESKKQLIKSLSECANIFISSEEKLPEEFIKYQVKIRPEQIHDVLANIDLYIGEGATMASECAMLGTPAIYINSLECGTTTEQEVKYGLVYNFRNSEGLIDKALSLMQIPDLKLKYIDGRNKLLIDKIDLTAFLLWFLKNYPESFIIMKDNPEFQNEFK